MDAEDTGSIASRSWGVTNYYNDCEKLKKIELSVATELQ
jgi:hypothetical protein